MGERSIGVVGGGIVGVAIARELAHRRPDASVVVFEKEDRLAAHQTGHNSGVVHAGIYYRPGSLKATLCTRGRHLLRDYCAEKGLPYDECGKLVVAVDDSELGRIEALERTATENGVPGLRRVASEEIPEIEPHAVGLTALHSPATAITDYVAVTEALAADVEAAGGRIRLCTPITGIARAAGRLEVRSGQERHRLDQLVLCPGLQADRVSSLADGQDGPRIVPFRGEYMSVRPAKQQLVRGLVYPVPDPRYPFLGVHFTRRVTGGLEVGPNAVLALKREGYRRTEVALHDLRSTLGWPGFWRLARQHWRTGITEVRGSLSVRAYMRAAQRYVPVIGADDVVRAGVGIRAQAIERDGTLVDDFRISHADGVTSVRNAPSPAATSSLAIAEYVVDRIEEAG
ncbi:MAG TPA: L-2-hydroxyglutarate oxidase [Nocardioides sp.]|uniref:L-2-hydroxyglutarate oxidase n=1 Tax=Nocardioides sp. TaxID=35761 RepID=UPI002B7B604F|nr:L-2-hydroxyglutarate oxidase [Nocardioides sp.]HQR27295.1 L-2-hydroxyglutarate oxidase [Nocardioides sp.]